MQNLTFTLPEESRQRLVDEINEWCQKGVRKRAKEWQQFAGWMNWVLNVYPLLRPALNNVYAKLKGKDQEARVWVNNGVREDLHWAKAKIDESDGIRVLKSITWEIDEASCIAKTDACPEGYAFWFPETNQGFTTSSPKGTPSTQIIFYEALAVLSALNHISQHYPPDSKIVIFTDNFPTVAMFSSLRALPEYNCILKAAINILLRSQLNLRVLHIAGEVNEVADALSRGEFMRALQLHPGLSIRTFQPYLRINRHQSPPLLQPPRQPLGEDQI
jgi:hypothetical protein